MREDWLMPMERTMVLVRCLYIITTFDPNSVITTNLFKRRKTKHLACVYQKVSTPLIGVTGVRCRLWRLHNAVTNLLPNETVANPGFPAPFSFIYHSLFNNIQMGNKVTRATLQGCKLPGGLPYKVPVNFTEFRPYLYGCGVPVTNKESHHTLHYNRVL